MMAKQVDYQYGFRVMQSETLIWAAGVTGNPVKGLSS